MLENINSQEAYLGLSRRRLRSFETKSIHQADVQKFIADGWQYFKKLKNSVQVKRSKSHSVLLEDRVWSLFYRMKFNLLSGVGGSTLIINPKDEKSPKTQIDVVAIDKEIAIAVECKSSLDFKKRPQFQEELGKFALVRENFIKSVRNQFSNDTTRKQCVLVMFLSKIILSDNDRERAKKNNIIVFDEHDLLYYEGLVSHLGPAAKYQVLADMLPGKEIPGLTIRIPAIKSKMGGYNCFNFSISPEYLLKISYVSHRSKGKASDINTYQRMLAKSRLNKIREYISDDGIFPTNIVLNFERNRLQFEKIKQETLVDDELDTGVLGWLAIKPAYKSAWIIDGQHRLFSYSGHDRALKSKLTVLAFEGLKPSKQAELFIDINAKQKSVKQSLLQELFAELHWDADDPSIRIRAIVSKSIQDLNADPNCCLYKRIQTTDGQKDNIRCITLTSLFGQIEKKGFYIVREKGGSIVEYGPLWGGNENNDTLSRTNFILKYWLNAISQINIDWWNKGSGDGGGLAMNDGVSTCINVLRSVFEFLESKKHKLVEYDNTELAALLKPYAISLGNYLAGLNEAQRKAFRDLRGVQGITVRTRQCQLGVRNEKPDFNPIGLDEWLHEQKQETNKKAKEMIDVMELTLQKHILQELKSEYGEGEDEWWYKGIPKTIRQKATQRLEDEDNKRGGREHYFDLIDYRKILTDNWSLFEKMFGYGKGSADKKTSWLGFTNELRKIVSHASAGRTVPLEQFNQLNEYYTWLQKQVSIDGSIESEEVAA